MMKTFAVAAMLFATAFRYERVVTPGAPGPNRLDVDVTLLAGAEPGLRDVRLADAQDREVGYLLVPPSTTEPEWIRGRMLPIKSTKTTSGFELDLGALRLVDAVKLDVAQKPFLKRVTLEGSGDRTHWTMLADATVFDLPDEQLRRDVVAFDGGEYRYIRVTWDDRSSARATASSASARLTPTRTKEHGPQVAIHFAKRASEPGKSRYRLELPGPHLPIAEIHVVVPSGNVLRNALITEPRLGNGQVTPFPIGSGTLRQEQIGELIASETKIDVASPAGRELDLVVEDGNNPPLNITRVYGELAPQPWIYFESPDGKPLRIRYGNETAKAPSYDIEALRNRVRAQKTEVAKLADSPGLDRVVTQPKMTIPLGAKVDRTQFRTVRKIQEGPVGLSVLPLDADVLARSPYLADVRIANPEGQQVPYLVERRAEPLPVKLTIPERRADGSKSIYAIDLPYEQWPEGTRLVLTTTARVFERTVTLRRAADSHRNREAAQLETATWSTADPELLPPSLTFGVPSGVGAIELVVDEGDNAPLPIESAQLLLPSSALRFYHPGTPLYLLYGNAKLTAPRYDIALLAPRLFGEPARDLGLGGADAAQNDGADDEEAPARKFFWIGIVVAAVVLVAMLARLLKAV